jgi:hypothetical protein
MHIINYFIDSVWSIQGVYPAGFDPKGKWKCAATCAKISRIMREFPALLLFRFADFLANHIIYYWHQLCKWANLYA